jgi:hypothetical protein
MWSDATLTTSESLEKYESEINNLTSENWDNAIAIAKEIIGDKLEVVLMERGVSVDEESQELLDVIANPEVFNMSSDYLTLSLIFDDLSQGADGLYKDKAMKYYQKFELKFAEDIKRMLLDDTIGIYRTNWKNRLVR